MTANGVTSAPVPDVVGMQTNLARSPSGGNLNARLRTSRNFSRRSAKLISGCSYSSHMTFAASIGEPPPRAMIVSGLNSRMIAAPRCTVPTLGSGSTSSNTWIMTSFERRLRTSRIWSTKPIRVIVWSVTIVTRLMPFMSLRYRIACGSK